jgi:predicted fused transcriptional regulator/phosphomethylpyrimidine kinase
MMPVELTGNLFKELRGRACRLLAEEGWTQSRLGKSLGVSQVMAGNYLHTLPTHFAEPIESDLQEASQSLAEILKSGGVSRWTLKLIVDDQELSLRFPFQDSREETLVQIANMQRRLSSLISLLSPQVRVNIAMATSGAVDKSGIAAFPGRLTPVDGRARPLSSPKFGGSSHLSTLLLDIRKFNPDASVIINLRLDSVVSDLLKRMNVRPLLLQREGEKLLINKEVIKTEALVDEGEHGFEPSLYIFGNSTESVIKIVEDLGNSLEIMA